MPRIITVTANPALDNSYTIPGFLPGEVYRPSSSRSTPGGKGINVARVLRTLGADVVATGILGGANGDEILRGLDQEGILHDFVHTDTLRTRQAIVILDPQTRQQTVINEVGPNVLGEQSELLQSKLSDLLVDTGFVVFSGSLAPGMDSSSYSILVSMARSRGVASLLDTSGEALKVGAIAEPNVIKVNAEEAAALGVEITEWEHDAATGAEQIRSPYRMAYAVITGGAKGAVLASKLGTFLAKSPALEVVSAVGSGDSFAAGLVHSLTNSPDDAEAALRLASACGAANTLSEGAGFCTLEQIEEISGRIIVDRVR